MTSFVELSPAILVESQSKYFNKERDFMETRQRNELGNLDQEDSEDLVDSQLQQLSTPLVLAAELQLLVEVLQFILELI